MGDAGPGEAAGPLNVRGKLSLVGPDAELDVKGNARVRGALTYDTLAALRFGAAEESTIASGVLTVTKSYVRVTSESGTTDTVDSILKRDAADGDILVLIPTATDTITYDDAVIDLGAATRATAPGGVIVLLYNGAIPSWQEVVFLAASDNVT